MSVIFFGHFLAPAFQLDSGGRQTVRARQFRDQQPSNGLLRARPSAVLLLLAGGSETLSPGYRLLASRFAGDQHASARAAPRPTAVEWTPSCPAISGSAAASRRRFRNTFAGLPATRLSVRRRSTRLSPGSTETNSRRMDSLLARNGLPACLPFSGPSLLFLLCRRFFSAAHVQTPCTR